MIKAFIFLSLFCTIFSVSSAQQTTIPSDTAKGNAFYSPEFKWRIIIPAGFVAQSATDYAAVHKQGADKIEQTFGEKVHDRTVQVCSYKSGPFNYFEVNKQAFNLATDGNHQEINKAVDSLLYKTFEKEMPGVKLDSTTYNEKVDGKVFDCFKLVAHLSDSYTLNTIIYTHLFGSYDLTISIVYLDEPKGRQLIDALRHSTFGE